MVKLLRVKGDSSKDDLEIRNMFTESVIVEPNSKLALRSVRVNLPSASADNESFDLDNDTTYKFLIGGGTGIGDDYATATVPAGNYDSANRLLNACQVAANSKNAGVYGYVHCHAIGNKAQFDLYETSKSDADFLSNGNWQILAGDTAAGGNTETTIISESPDPAEDFNAVLIETIPLTHNLMRGALGTTQANTGTVRIGAIAHADGTCYYGLKADGQAGTDGAYTIVIDDVETVVTPSDAGNITQVSVTAGGTGYSDNDTGAVTGGSGTGAQYAVLAQAGGIVSDVVITDSGDRQYQVGDTLTLAGSGNGDCTVKIDAIQSVVQIGDQLQVEKLGSNAVITMARAGLPLNGTAAIRQTVALSQDCLNDQKLYWDITGLNHPTHPVSLNNVQVTIIELNPDPSLLGSGQPTSGSVQFPPDSRLGYNVLGHLLGFPDSTAYSAVGDPARIIAPKPLGGLLNYPGVMLGIEGLDLESYNGGIDVQPQGLSIVDVLYPEDDTQLNVIQMRVNDPMKLNIKNETRMGLRDIRLAFYKDAEDSLGKSTGRYEKLRFIGTPVVVLEIYDPDE